MIRSHENRLADVTQPGNGTRRYQFAGRENDATALYFYRGVTTAPASRGFIAHDPMDFLCGDLNLYGYAANQPTGLIDPLGLSYWTNITFLWNFLTGGGQTNRSYGPASRPRK
jgi:RHS repeat-associated protein